MTTGEWFLGGATLLLAIGAFYAVWQNYRLRKQDSETRVKIETLNELINWIRLCNQATANYFWKYEEEKRNPQFNAMRVMSEISQVAIDIEFFFNLELPFGSDFDVLLKKTRYVLDDYMQSACKQDGTTEKVEELIKNYRRLFGLLTELGSAAFRCKLDVIRGTSK